MPVDDPDVVTVRERLLQDFPEAQPYWEEVVAELDAIGDPSLGTEPGHYEMIETAVLQNIILPAQASAREAPETQGNYESLCRRLASFTEWLAGRASESIRMGHLFDVALLESFDAWGIREDVEPFLGPVSRDLMAARDQRGDLHA